MDNVDPQPSPTDFRAIVEEHSVQFEVERHQEMVDGKARSVGFDVLLSGVPAGEDGEEEPSPDETRRVWQRLQVLGEALVERARAIDLLDGVQDVRIRIRAFDGTIHHSPRRNHRADVELAILIRHSGDHYFDPVDDEEVEGTQGIAEILQGWGAERAG